MKSMKRHNDVTLEDEPPGPVGVQHATGKSGKTAPERMKRLSQSGNDTLLWICLVVKRKSDAIKNNTA